MGVGYRGFMSGLKGESKKRMDVLTQVYKEDVFTLVGWGEKCEWRGG